MNERLSSILQNAQDRCAVCGQCLYQCPQMDFTLLEAKAEKQKLLAGLPNNVLSRCTSCFACQAVCPNDADPHGLILFRRNEKRPEAPFFVRPGLPGYDGPNPWNEIKKYFTAEEKDFFASLSKPAKGKEVLFLGCNQLLNPFVAMSPMFADLPAVASPGICCGEPAFRLGLFERFEEQAAAWAKRWAQDPPSRMVFFCPAGLNMIRNVYPARLGIEIPFPVVSVFDWIEERLDSFGPPKPLGTKVILHDSCHAKMLGEPFYDQIRRLFAWAGVEVIEMEKSRADSLCCGFASIGGRYNPLDMTAQAKGRLKEARDSGADALGVYCNGCGIMFSVVNRFGGGNVEMFHLVELLGLAMGHAPLRLHDRRAAELCLAAGRALVKSGLGKI